MKSHIVMIALLSSVLAHAQGSPAGQNTSAATAVAAMSPEQRLTSARTVALVGALGHVAETGIALNPSAKKAQELIDKEVRRWGRFTIIDDPARADLVLILWEGNRAAGGGGTIRTARLAVFPGGTPPKRGDIPLWDGDASGTIFATSGTPKVVAKFRAYLENLEKTVPAVTLPPPVANPANPAPSESAQAVTPESTATGSAANVAPVPNPAAVPAPAPATKQARKYVPPFEIIDKARTYTTRGKGPAGEQGTVDKLFGIGKYSNLQLAMRDIDQQMLAWGRMRYVEEVPKADLVIMVYQWDERAYSRQFHGVRSAIQIAEGGEAFQRSEPALWASGTVSGSTRDLIANFRFEFDRFSQMQTLEATHVANKNYDRGCDWMKSAEKKKQGQRSGLLFEVIAELRKSVRADYGYAPAHERLATALRDLGFDANAVYEYKLALRLQPGMQEALKGLASAMTSFSKDDEAQVDQKGGPPETGK
jgi:hypothetical protein